MPVCREFKKNRHQGETVEAIREMGPSGRQSKLFFQEEESQAWGIGERKKKFEVKGYIFKILMKQSLDVFMQPLHPHSTFWLKWQYFSLTLENTKFKDNKINNLQQQYLHLLHRPASNSGLFQAVLKKKHLDNWTKVLGGALK